MDRVRSSPSALPLPLPLLLLSVVACSATKTVTLTSEPEGATVYLNGREAGITTLRQALDFGATRQYVVTLRKDGYEEGRTTITYEPASQTLYQLELKKKETVSVPLVSVEPVKTAKGLELAITRKETLAFLETIERSPNVSSVTQITSNQDPAVNIGGPVLSPKDDILIFAEMVEEANGGSYSNLHRLTVGSTAKTRLTFGKFRDMFPSVTSDGEFVVFSSDRTSETPTLWRVRLSGEGGIVKLTGSPAQDFSPSVGPDSATIAYASIPRTAEWAQIWTIDASGRFPTQLREGSQPQVSPDGKRILFVRTAVDTRHSQLWVMKVDGGEETQLSQNTGFDVIDPRWSPDGKWIVYASSEALDSQKNRNFDIWMSAADGSGKTQLTTNGSRDDSPCWDHSGRYIYFRSNRGGSWNIWRFEPAKTEPARNQ